MSSDRREPVRVEITNKNESFRRKVNGKSEFTEKVDTEISCFTESAGGNQLEDGGENPMEKAVLFPKEEFKCQRMLKKPVSYLNGHTCLCLEVL